MISVLDFGYVKTFSQYTSVQAIYKTFVSNSGLSIEMPLLTLLLNRQ